MKRTTLVLTLILLSLALSAQSVYVYGPGGPYPAIKAIADQFQKEYSIKIVLTAGPFTTWEDHARQNADLIYSGSEDMMTGFIQALDNIEVSTIYPLFFRRSGLIVRKGNPKNIRTMSDLKKPDIKIMVVNGSGLIGVWEDMFSKLPRMEDFRKIRDNIKVFANNSGVAERQWTGEPSIDVWVTWNIWQMRNHNDSEFIKLPEKYTVYRDTGIALTHQGKSNKNASLFYDYLKSKKAAEVFRKSGWNDK